MPIAYHVILKLENEQVIASTDTERRVVARTVLECSRGAGLLAFSQADTHIHNAPSCDRPEAGRLAHSIETSLRYRLGLEVPFAPAYIKPIDDGRHLYNTFRYLLRQPERHGIALDPFREASNLPDLLGLRLIGAYTAGNVRRLLPRVQRRELLELLGVPALEPADAPLEALLQATLAAAALPSLAGSGAEANAARRAAIAVAGDRVRPSDLAELLACSRRTIFRHKRGPIDPALVLAIRRQLHLRAQRMANEGAFIAQVA